MKNERAKHHTKASLFEDVAKLKKALMDIHSISIMTDSPVTKKINAILENAILSD